MGISPHLYLSYHLYLSIYISPTIYISPWSSLHSPQPLSDICLYWLSFLYSDLILKVKLKFCFNGIIVQPCCNIFHLLFKRFHLSWYCLYLYWALLQHLLVDHISCFIKWLDYDAIEAEFEFEFESEMTIEESQPIQADIRQRLGRVKRRPGRLTKKAPRKAVAPPPIDES